MNIICCSGGNDSVALIRWAYENKLKDVTVLYNYTGWEISWWNDRMKEIQILCEKYNFEYTCTFGVTFKDLIRFKKGFPMPASNMQFCSYYLKTQPTFEWLKKIDPNGKAVIYIGIRRCESQNRANHPRRILADTRYGGRPMEFPLVIHSDMDRDLLIEKTDIDILLHGSMECFPCVNSKRSDFRLLANHQGRIQEVADLEREMGFTKKGKPKVMFRPYRHMGATGIKEVVKWGLADHGKYNK